MTEVLAILSNTILNVQLPVHRPFCSLEELDFRALSPPGYLNICCSPSKSFTIRSPRRVMRRLNNEDFTGIQNIYLVSGPYNAVTLVYAGARESCSETYVYLT